jgi:hypothetical protein
MSVSATISKSISESFSPSSSTTVSSSLTGSPSATPSETLVQTTTYLASFVNSARPYVTKDNLTIVDTPYPTSVLTLIGYGFHKTARQNHIQFERVSRQVPQRYTPKCTPVYAQFHTDKFMRCLLNTSEAFGSFIVKDVQLDANYDVAAQISTSSVTLMLRPMVTAVEGCVVTDPIHKRGTFNCVDHDVITIFGYHFDPDFSRNNVTFFNRRTRHESNITCRPLSGTTTRLTCRLMNLSPTVPGPFTVRVHADKLATKEWAPIVIDSVPMNVTLLAVQGCNSTRGDELFGCHNNSIIRLFGLGFSNDLRQMQVQMLPAGDGAGALRCQPLAAYGYYQMTCKVTVIGDSIANGRFYIRAKTNPPSNRWFQYWSNAKYVTVAPVLESVTGCSQHVSRVALATQLCRHGDVVTITGHGFSPVASENTVIVQPAEKWQLPGLKCDVVRVNSDGRTLYCKVNQTRDALYGKYNLNVASPVDDPRYYSLNTGALYTQSQFRPTLELLTGCATPNAHAPVKAVTLCYGDNQTKLELYGTNFYRSATDNWVRFFPVSKYASGHIDCHVTFIDLSHVAFRGTKLTCSLAASLAGGTFRVALYRPYDPETYASVYSDGPLTISTVPYPLRVHGCPQQPSPTRTFACEPRSLVSASGVSLGNQSRDGRALSLSLRDDLSSGANTLVTIKSLQPYRRLTFFFPSSYRRDGAGILNITREGQSNLLVANSVKILVSAEVVQPRIFRVAGCSNATQACTSIGNVTLTLVGYGFVEAHSRQAGRVLLVPANGNATGRPHCDVMFSGEKRIAVTQWSRATCALYANDASGTFFVHYMVSTEGGLRTATSPKTLNATVHFGPLVTGIAGCDGVPHSVVSRYKATINGSMTLPDVFIFGKGFPLNQRRMSVTFHAAPAGGAIAYSPSTLLRCREVVPMTAFRVLCRLDGVGAATRGLYAVKVRAHGRGGLADRKVTAFVNTTVPDLAGVSYALNMQIIKPTSLVGLSADTELEVQITVRRTDTSEVDCDRYDLLR